MKQIINLCQQHSHHDSIQFFKQTSLTSPIFSSKLFQALPKRNTLSKFRIFNTNGKKYGVGVGVGLTLFGAGLLEHIIHPDFKQYHIPTHNGNPNCKNEFEAQFGSYLRNYNGKLWIYGMIAANILVFTGWQFGNVEFMQRHFLCSFENLNAKRFHVLFTSNWSHFSYWHIGLNMYVLYNFGEPMFETLGIVPFLGVYMAAGIFGSLSSVGMHRLLKVKEFASLGASGSLLGIIATFSMYLPEAQLKFILSPDSMAFSAKYGIAGLVAFDTLGLIMRWKYLDHAAHLGGTLTGLLFWKFYSQMYGTSINSNNDEMLFHERDEIDMTHVLPCNGSQYVFSGSYKNLKPCDKYGIFYAPNRTYFGEIIDRRFIFNGKGCLRNEQNGTVFYGHFRNGRIDGIGILEYPNGMFSIVEYDIEKRQFIPALEYQQSDLDRLLRKVDTKTMKNLLKPQETKEEIRFNASKLVAAVNNEKNNSLPKESP